MSEYIRPKTFSEALTNPVWFPQESPVIYGKRAFAPITPKETRERKLGTWPLLFVEKILKALNSDIATNLPAEFFNKVGPHIYKHNSLEVSFKILSDVTGFSIRATKVLGVIAASLMTITTGLSYLLRATGIRNEDVPLTIPTPNSLHFKTPESAYSKAKMNLLTKIVMCEGVEAYYRRKGDFTNAATAAWVKLNLRDLLIPDAFKKFEGYNQSAFIAEFDGLMAEVTDIKLVEAGYHLARKVVTCERLEAYYTAKGEPKLADKIAGLREVLQEVKLDKTDSIKVLKQAIDKKLEDLMEKSGLKDTNIDDYLQKNKPLPTPDTALNEPKASRAFITSAITLNF